MSTGETTPLDPRPLTSHNVVADHVKFTRSPYKLVPTLLRSQSVAGRAILAHLASDGQVSPQQLESIGQRSDAPSVTRLLDPRVAGAYARVLAHQPGDGDEGLAALELLEALQTVHGVASLDPRDVNLYVQLLSLHRHRRKLLDFLRVSPWRAENGVVSPGIQAMVLADAHNPFLYPGAGLEVDRFVELFNDSVDPSASPAPIRLLGEGTTPFGRLAGAPLPRATGPLITVVTSAYNPDHALLGAARSLIAQTWANWEMIIVDDASTSATAQSVLREAERLDSRVRVIRKRVNGGTYRARNTALMQSRGTFMTFLDSDDWAHPVRLEEGVRPMLEHAGILATRSRGTRATEDLELSRPGYGPHFLAASSLMFRIPEVPARIGFFDPVRKAADTEYARRIEAAFGRRVHDIGGGALTILRRAGNTLSADEFSFGWRHQSRWAYKQAYGARHYEIRRGADPFTDPTTPSPHFGVHSWAKEHDPEYRRDRRFDVVIAGDWRRYGGPQVSMLEEIAALRAGGLRVGVMHLEAMRFRTQEDSPLCEPLQALLRKGAVELLFADDAAEIRILILRYPPILQFPPVVRHAVRPEKVFIMANQAPAEPDGTDQRYVPVDVHRNATELFGTEPRWIPQSTSIRTLLTPLLPAEAITSWDNPAIIDPGPWYSPRTRPAQHRPVVGRYSRDTAIKFPRTGHDLLAAYGLPATVEVRMMGATQQVARLLEQAEAEPPPNWTLLEHRAVDPRQFLADLDVVIYMDNPDANEAFGRVLLESAASGALVIASPKHRINFGDALLYAEPGEVAEVVRRYLAKPELFKAQVELTQRRVRQRWSHEQFLANIRWELDESSRNDPTMPPSTEPPSGELELRANWDGTVTVVNRLGNLTAATASIRRHADAELTDSLIVVHHIDNAHLGQNFAHSVARVTAPGSMPSALDAALPPGVHAVVHYADGQWTAQVGPGGRFETASGALHLMFS